MDVRFRPISTWPADRTRPGARRNRSSFKAGWSDTLEILDRELRQLGARNIVVEVAMREADIRIDGWPRADARATDPGVVISFDSRFGPLRYATDVFEIWQHNVRAIALGLEALRKVDRYGITRRGEQYTGWKALPPGIALGPAKFASRSEAAEWIAKRSEIYDVHDLLYVAERARDAYRIVAKKVHPDAGGSTEDFQRLEEAWALVSERVA